MSDGVSTDGISGLRVVRECSAWRLSFESSHGGWLHQLYVNGELADVTDSAGERSFVVDAAGPAELVVAAVNPEFGWQDFSAELPAGGCGWAVDVRCICWPAPPEGATVTVVSDLAGGPVAVAEAWPAEAARWAWGQDCFGEGGFGWDGANGLGAGVGAFGAGPFGIDTPVAVLKAVLAKEGRHELSLVTSWPDGGESSEAIGEFRSTPPPQAARSVAVAGYDKSTSRLIISIQ